jgi:ATP-binding cassette subfamily C (CFTR/MRP) protein 1
MILGDIGSGKSSLLYSLLAEMKPVTNRYLPSININGTVAFVAQKPSILNCSIEDNILMTHSKNQKLFEEAIHFSCLYEDIINFTNGEKTIIG